MERLFWSLKHGWTSHRTYSELPAARLSVLEYMAFYNCKRIYQALRYMPPEQYKSVHAPAIKAAQSNPHRYLPFMGQRSAED